MTKRSTELLVWSLIILGLGAIVLGIYAVIATPKATDGSTLLVPVSASDWKKGNENAKVVLVEYSDFQCPACKYYYGVVKQLVQEKGESVQVIYRHFPLQQHQFAKSAAIASESAGRQGKFWEMHDMLFERQEEWSVSGNIDQTLVSYATQLGLNIPQFQTDMQSPEIIDKIERSILEGGEQKIQGTPTFYLNGVQIEFSSYEELKTAVEKVI